VGLAFTTRNGSFTESQELRREPKARLSAQELFAESMVLPTAQRSFAESLGAPALGEGPTHGASVIRRERRGQGAQRRTQLTAPPQRRHGQPSSVKFAERVAYLALGEEVPTVQEPPSPRAYTLR
jgi:hypothetical protein